MKMRLKIDALAERLVFGLAVEDVFQLAEPFPAADNHKT
jgi:hypothetical protein